MPTIRESFSVRDRLGHVNLILPTLREELQVESRVAVTLSLRLTESFSVHSSTSGRGYVVVSEQLKIHATPLAKATIFKIVQDSFSASDSLSSATSRRDTLVEQFSVSSRTPHVVLRTSLKDIFFTSARYTTSGVDRSILRDAFQVRDALTAKYRLILREGLNISGQAYLGPTIRRSLRDTFFIRATPSSIVGGSVQVREQFSARGRVLPRAQLRAVAHEWFAINDTLYPHFPALQPSIDDFTKEIPLGDTSVWTAPLDGWGMSRYVGLPVTEFIGTRFGVGPDGVYTGDVDYPVSYIRTGFVRLDDSAQPLFEKKRVNYVYTYSAHEEPLKVAVTADYNGTRRTEVYTQENRPSTETRAVRCGVGRGFATNYVALQVGGPPFDMAAMEVQMNPSKRRL